MLLQPNFFLLFHLLLFYLRSEEPFPDFLPLHASMLWSILTSPAHDTPSTSQSSIPRLRPKGVCFGSPESVRCNLNLFLSLSLCPLPSSFSISLSLSPPSLSLSPYPLHLSLCACLFLCLSMCLSLSPLLYPSTAMPAPLSLISSHLVLVLT